MVATLSRRSLLLGTLGHALAQEVEFSTSVDVVTLLATVRNRDGRIVNDLNRDDFILSEDGRAQSIRYFSRESNLALTLGLLVDTSRSQSKVLESERQASYVFLDRMLRRGDEAFVVSFDVGIHMLQGVTDSRKLLSAALDQLEIPGRVATLLYDALHLTSDNLMREQQGRKAFIVLSDGVDVGSKTTLGSAIEYVQRADTFTYSIWYHGKRKRWAALGGPALVVSQSKYRETGKATMQRLASETGGRFFEVTEDSPIESIYEQIEEELRNQYSLGYTPDHRDNNKQYRKIELTTRRPGLIVQTRAGYYPR